MMPGRVAWACVPANAGLLLFILTAPCHGLSSALRVRQWHLQEAES